MKRLTRTLFYVTCSCLVGFQTELAAQENPGNASSASSTNEIVRLPELLVTATRTEEQSLELPYSASVLGRERIRNEQMSSSLPEALLEQPGVMVQQTAHGQGSPFIRGFTGFRTLMLVDGIRLNNSTFREGPNQYWSTVDALAVDRLEVVRGPGSALYGSDAIGGTVNALMKAPQYGPSQGVDWSGAAYYRFGSAESAHLGRGEIGASEGERWGFTLGLTGKRFGDLEGGRDVGKQPHTGYDQWDADAKAEYFFRPSTKLTLAWQHTRQDDVERTHRTIHGLTWEGLSRGTDLHHSFDQVRDLTYARLTHNTERGDRFTGTVSWQSQDEKQFVERANSTLQRNGVNVSTLGLALQVESPSRVGTWTYGVEYYRDFVGSYQRNYNAAGALTSTAIQGPVADDSHYDLLGIYVQDDIPLGENWRLLFGGRFTWAQADAGRLRDPLTGLAASFEDDWVNFSGNARLLWHPDQAKRWSLYTGVAQGFRAPNLSDLTRFDIARSGELETAALKLEPENFVSLETGVKTEHERWEAGAAYYRTFIRDLIVRTPTGVIIGGTREVTKRNASEGWVHGIELNTRVGLGEGFSVYGVMAWQEGKADAFPTSTAQSERAPLSRLHPLTGLAGLRWDAPKRNGFAEIFGVMTAEQDRLSPDDARDTQRIPPGGTPGWTTLNLRAGCDWFGCVKTVAAVENILDEDYRIHGSGFNQAGRNFKISLEYRF